MIFLSHKIHGNVIIPTYIIIPVYLICSARCIKFGLILKAQVFFTLQLIPYLVILGWSNDYLYPAIIDDILFMQL